MEASIEINDLMNAKVTKHPIILFILYLLIQVVEIEHDPEDEKEGEESEEDSEEEVVGKSYQLFHH